MRPLPIIACLLAGLAMPLLAVETKPKPPNLVMTLARIVDDVGTDHDVLVINGVIAHRTLAAFKRTLNAYPPGTRLIWDPGCDRSDWESTLTSAATLEEIRKHCAGLTIEFVVVPSG